MEKETFSSKDFLTKKIIEINFSLTLHIYIYCQLDFFGKIDNPHLLFLISKILPNKRIMGALIWVK